MEAPIDWLSVANQIVPVLVLVTCLAGAYRNVKNAPLALWTPVPWFLVACAAYFGFGPLVYHFGTEESVNYVNTFYEIDEFTLLRTNLLNVVGIAIVAMGYFIGKLIFRQVQPPIVRQFDYVETRRLMLFFLVIGLFVEYVFAMPYRLGLLSWTLPGSIQYLSGFLKIAIILLIVLVYRGYRRYFWLLFGLIGAEIIMTLMTFSKQAVIEVLMAIGLGWYLMRPNVRMLVVGGVAVALLYIYILSPFMSFGRIAYSGLGAGTTAEVTGSIAEYQKIKIEDLESFIPGVQSWWTRLTYANAQAFALNAYDQGERGESIGLINYVFLPRLLFPSKPVMTPGREFTAAVTGEDTETATAPGIFAEAYWNGGWFMVVLVCLYVGVLFAGCTVFSEHTIAVGQYEYLPVVMAGISMGYQPNDWLVVVYVGTIANAVVLYIILRYVVMPLIRSSLVRNITKGPGR